MSNIYVTCECPHEDCDDPVFEAYLDSLKETTCCPNCLRQQMPRVVGDKAVIDMRLKMKKIDTERSK